jgi:ribosome-associated heat shock protein Hsp15
MVRVDKWLWAARLAKTRALAAEAVKGGRVEINGQRVKPSKEVRLGDEIEITSGADRRVVIVQALAERRGPAKEAALLYEETPESVSAREELAAQRRMEAAPRPQPGGRPTKRDRRRMETRRGRRS